MTTTITVKYRDMSNEDVSVLHTRAMGFVGTGDFQRFRGQPVEIEIPHVARGPSDCGAPWYRVVSDGPPREVCPHIAEIGD